MWFMYLISWLALLIQLMFVTLSIAAGLYYLAELVEEYTVMTAKIIKYMIVGTTVIYIGLLFEDLPLSLTVTGLFTNFIYLMVLKTFPFIELSSPVFLLSLCMIVVNHYLAFQYFSTVWHPFSEVLAFFTLCLWLVPFAFFVSLSANENTLPSTMDRTGDGFSPRSDEDSDIVSSYFKRKSKKYNLMGFLKSAQDTLLPQRVKKGY